MGGADTGYDGRSQGGERRGGNVKIMLKMEKSIDKWIKRIYLCDIKMISK
jgi:hypothetical protein